MKIGKYIICGWERGDQHFYRQVIKYDDINSLMKTIYSIQVYHSVSYDDSSYRIFFSSNNPLYNAFKIMYPEGYNIDSYMAGKQLVDAFLEK
jgi:hypothetical protein